MYLKMMGWIRDNVQKEVSEYLFNIKINLPERVGTYQRDIIPDLEIDFENLQAQLGETQEMICFFDMLLAEQTAKVAMLEHRLRLTKAEITERVLEKWRGLDKEIRRMDLKDLIEKDQDITTIQVKIIAETMRKDKLEATIKGLEKKSDHLRSLAGFARNERKQTGI